MVQKKKKRGFDQWKALITSFLMQSIVLGTIESYGALLQPFSEVILPEDKNANSKAALIGSLTTGSLMGFSPLSGWLIQHLGPQTIALFGAYIVFFSTLLTSCLQSYYLVTLLYGVFFGIGASFLFLSSNVVISRYFEDNSAIAYGIVGLGNGVANAIMPHVMKFGVSKIKLRGIIRLLCLLLSSNLFFPLFWSSEEDTDLDDVLLCPEGKEKRGSISKLSLTNAGSSHHKSVNLINKQIGSIESELSITFQTIETSLNNRNVNCYKRHIKSTSNNSRTNPLSLSLRKRSSMKPNHTSTKSPQSKVVNSKFSRHKDEIKSLSFTNNIFIDKRSLLYGDGISSNLNNFKRYSLSNVRNRLPSSHLTGTTAKILGRDLLVTDTTLSSSTEPLSTKSVFSNKYYNVKGKYNALPDQSSISSGALSDSMQWNKIKEDEDNGPQQNCYHCSGICSPLLLANRTYITLLCTMPISMLGYQVPNVHIVNFCNKIFPQGNGELLLTCLGVASAIGPFLNALILNNIPYKISKFRLFQVFVISYGLIVITLSLSSQYVHLIIICITIGYLDGSITSFIGPLIIDLVGRQLAGQAMGLYYGVIAISVVIAPVLAGYLYDLKNSYIPSFYAAGIFFVLGGLLMSISCAIDRTHVHDTMEIYTQQTINSDISDVSDEMGFPSQDDATKRSKLTEELPTLSKSSVKQKSSIIKKDQKLSFIGIKGIMPSIAKPRPAPRLSVSPTMVLRKQRTQSSNMKVSSMLTFKSNRPSMKSSSSLKKFRAKLISHK